MSERAHVPERVSVLLGRPARWLPSGFALGDYDGVERTLEVFNVDAREELSLRRMIRSHRAELEAAAGGSIVFVFHSRFESIRLYGEFLREAGALPVPRATPVYVEHTVVKPLTAESARQLIDQVVSRNEVKPQRREA